MQIVFSTLGGAVSELNLTEKSSTSPNSIILPIEIDKKIKEISPQNDMFPLNSYYTNSKNNSSEYHEKGKLGGYYPLLRRALNDVNNTYKYYLCKISDEEEESPTYKVTRFEDDLIEFEAVLDQRKITKTYSFIKEAPYCFDLKIKVEGTSNNLWLFSGVPEVELISGQYSPSIRYRTLSGSKSSVEQVKLKAPIYDSTSNLDWVSDSNGFFGIIIDPLSDKKPGFRTQIIEGEQLPTRLTLIDKKYDKYPAKKYPGYGFLLPIKGKQENNFRVFAGPYQTKLLKHLDKVFSNPVTGYNPNYYSALSFKRFLSFISEPFSKLLFFLMQTFYAVTKSWGFSIILLTVVLRLMLYPLNAISIKSNAKMQEVAPKAQAIKERYKKDPQRTQVEIMKLYKEAGANPMSGCLPLVIQMPFLIGMFELLKSSFDLRGASFIPGWINNLTSPDVILSWNYNIFFIGTELHLLPLLLGLVMFIQPKLFSKTTKDKSLMTEQQKNAQMMGTTMAIVFTFIFYNFPSGLNLYWLSSSLLGLVQQWYNTKKLNPVK